VLGSLSLSLSLSFVPISCCHHYSYRRNTVTYNQYSLHYQTHTVLEAKRTQIQSLTAHPQRQFIDCAVIQTHITANQHPSIGTPLSAATMCLITTPRKDRYELRREDRYDAPRPVSNFHGGPHYQHDHARSSRTYSRPPADFRRSVSRSSRVYDIEPRRSGREVDYVRTSRTYVR
jgi:hypothetical protein